MLNIKNFGGKQFFNRELSWLKFNERVLEEATDSDRPMLERLKFISIFANNLDEFFMIRVAGVINQSENDVLTTDDSGMTPDEQLEALSLSAHALVKRQYSYLKSIFDGLKPYNIGITDYSELSEKDKDWFKGYFHNFIFPVITPLGVDSAHPFPMLANKTINIAVALRNSVTGEEKQAIVPVPGILPRFMEVPNIVVGKKFVMLEDVIKNNLADFFQGYVIREQLLFRVTRDNDMEIDEDDTDDLLVEVARSLRKRKRGDAVRIEISGNSRRLRSFIKAGTEVYDADIFKIEGPLDCTCFFKFFDLFGAEYEFLRQASFTPVMPRVFLENENIFEVLSERDVLLHHPYMSFEPVINFVRQAAEDPQVLAIKQTLYRVSGNSPIVRALAKAAENGKQVTVLVELKARFDEENNIQWARRLEEAGCHVIYGLVGLKTHAKISLVVRKEGSGIKRYVHLGTGNYNDSTAKIYTDMSLMTTNGYLCSDASAFFNVISGYSDPPVWNKIAIAPLGMRARIYELINREIEQARRGANSRIIAKMNSLVDKGIVEMLYRASGAGVKIDLIIRGVCVLRPGVKGLSENITVRSIVGRFLEHSRVFIFENNGDREVFLSSADWMPRNIDRRVEILFPIVDAGQITEVSNWIDLTLKDNCKAWELQFDGDYKKIHAGRHEKIKSQRLLMEWIIDANLDKRPQYQPKIQPIKKQ
ncbi:MAG: RNA degradosome polyphosphate kinase [Bacillota bacterium]